jgi:hypothetical protein
MNETQKRFLQVYKLPLNSLKLLYIKRIRRHGTVKMHILNSMGDITETFIFTLLDKKCQEGQTVVSNGMEFPTIFEAWSWYEGLLLKAFG